MRKTLQAAKAIITLLLAILCALFALVLCYSPVFDMGEVYEVSYGLSSSAQTKRTENPLFEKLTGAVAGESVRYAGDRYEALKEKFGATLLFTEEACGVTNYYLYSRDLGEGCAVGGYLVNLHIAVSEEETAVGTPLIFGGF